MNVVLTAPIPGVRTPSFPFGGAMLTGLRILIPQCALDLREKVRRGVPRSATMQIKTSMMREGARICNSIYYVRAHDSRQKE